MFEDITYHSPLYMSWALELKGSLRLRDYQLSTGHSIQIVAAYMDFASQDHIATSPPHQSDRLFDAFTVNPNRVEKRAVELNRPAALILSELMRLHDEERDSLQALAKRLVRNVLRNCKQVRGEYIHPVLLTIADAELSKSVVSASSYVDFLYSRYPFSALETFGDIRPHPGTNGHFMANPDAALNIAAFLYHPALSILSMKHPKNKDTTMISPAESKSKSVQPEEFEMPNPDEVQEAQDTVTALKQEVENYRDVAQSIDDEYRDRNEDRKISLDDLPYGEELIRIRPHPEMLIRAESLLSTIGSKGISAEHAMTAFSDAIELIDEVRADLNDFTPIPQQ